MATRMPSTTVRVDPEVKERASAILSELGLSMSAAFNLFLKAVIREGGIPFELKVDSGKCNVEIGVDTDA